MNPVVLRLAFGRKARACLAAENSFKLSCQNKLLDLIFSLDTSHTMDGAITVKLQHPTGNFTLPGPQAAVCSARIISRFGSKLMVLKAAALNPANHFLIGTPNSSKR